MHCPECKSENVSSNGSYLKYGTIDERVKKYRCRDCRKGFTESAAVSPSAVSAPTVNQATHETPAPVHFDFASAFAAYHGRLPEPEPVAEVVAEVVEAPIDEPQRELAAEREVRKLRAELGERDRRIKMLHDEIDRSSAFADVWSSLQKAPLGSSLAPSIVHTPTGDGTAILLASDWHVGETVDPRTVNNLNEYNPEIAEERAHNYFRNSLKLVKKERQDLNVRNLIWWLGGDLMTGFLHEELEESNSMSPIEETIFLQKILSTGLKYYLDHGDFESITVVCNYGNHGRTTKKKRISTGARNSYEWGVYRSLERAIVDPTLQWNIADGYTAYVESLGYRMRFSHGDLITYLGGTGGVTVPLNRWIDRVNKQIRVDRDFLGHFHTLFNGPNFTLNGSLIGPSSYSVSLGFAPERPQQAFQILDARRGFTVSAPILVTEEKAAVSVAA